MIIERGIHKPIRAFAKMYPIIAVTGPRQSGKTTMLKTLFSDFTYISLENPDIRAFAETDPNGFLKQYNKHVIFDEVQRVPSLFSYIQTIVDESKIMGQFILSGSQNFHLLQSITQSLAGRVALFKLLPFDFQELNKAGLLSSDYIKNMVRGFYPAIYDRNIPSKSFYSNYIQTYIKRDVSELITLKDHRPFENFLSLCATRAGQLLNLNSLAKDCGISQPTAKAWLSALESSYIIFLLKPYHKNFSKRIVKSPKLYFYDSGLLLHLLKLYNYERINSHPIKGSIFENMMISEYVKRIYHTSGDADIWFWRDSAGNEVDLIIDDGINLKIIELKSGLTITPDLFKGLNWFENISKITNLEKTLVYGGDDNQSRSYGNVLSWADFGKELKFSE